MKARGAITFLACIAPLALHLAVLGDSTAVMVFFSLIIVLNFALYSIGRHLPRWLLIAGALGAVFLFFAYRELALQFAFLPPMLIYMLFGWLFGRTLMRPRMPLVQRIAELEHGGPLPAEMAAYARGVTWTWTAFFMSMTIVSMLLFQFATLAAWSFFTNVFGYLAIPVLFIGEYWLRVRRFPHYQFDNPLRAAINVTRRAPEVFR